MGTCSGALAAYTDSYSLGTFFVGDVITLC